MKKSLLTLIEEATAIIELSNTEVRTNFQRYGFYGYDIIMNRLIKPMTTNEMRLFTMRTLSDIIVQNIDKFIQNHGLLDMIEREGRVTAISIDRLRSTDRWAHITNTLEDLFHDRMVILISKPSLQFKSHYEVIERRIQYQQITDGH